VQDVPWDNNLFTGIDLEHAVADPYGNLTLKDLQAFLRPRMDVIIAEKRHGTHFDRGLFPVRRGRRFDEHDRLAAYWPDDIERRSRNQA
jgi:hypothetical protein